MSAVSTTADRPATRHDIVLTRQSSRMGDVVFKLALQLCLLVACAFLVWILAFALYKGWARLDSRLWENMPTGIVSRVPGAGVQSAIMGTVWIAAITAAICLPTGILSAIYLEEYANPQLWYNRVLELNIQNLAGVPSIIFGILGLGIARTLGFGFGPLTGGIVLALLVLPTIIIATREAIRAVPQSIRHASYALGATKWQTVARQVLPSAVPGIATGSILALSRAIGEAAPLIVLGAVTFVTFNPEGVKDSYTALPVHIFGLITKAQGPYQELGAAAIVLLLVMVLLMNSIAIFVRNKFQKRW